MSVVIAAVNDLVGDEARHAAGGINRDDGPGASVKDHKRPDMQHRNQSYRPDKTIRRAGNVMVQQDREGAERCGRRHKTGQEMRGWGVLGVENPNNHVGERDAKKRREQRTADRKASTHGK